MWKNNNKKKTENGSIVGCNQSLWKPWDAKLIWDFIHIHFKAEIFTVAAKLKALMHIKPGRVNNLHSMFHLWNLVGRKVKPDSE